MPRLVVTQTAAQGMEHCRRFLAEKNPRASRRAGQIIKNQLTLLEAQPEIGKPLDELPKFRELVIPFGDSGYVALYRYDAETDRVYVLAFRHQEEAGY